MSWAYYNENDPEKVAALKALMSKGWIAPGEIDSRDIRDVAPIELSRFAQCHFFAGIGLWSVAARAAGIPDDWPFWSGSCPCQPFSSAGAGDGVADDRHLWPHWFWLIAQRRPRRIVGEQVGSKDGLAWLDLVCADMEGSGYAGGALDLCSAGFGAPNIRQRLYMCWLDDELGDGWREGRDRDHAGHERIELDPDGPDGGLADDQGAERARGRPSRRRRDRLADGGAARGMDDRERAGLERQRGHGDRAPGWESGSARSAPEAGDARGLENADRAGQGDGGLQPGGEFRGLGGDPRRGPAGDPSERDAVPDPVPAATRGFWADADWLLCRDPDGPKLRPVRRGTFCLAAGYPGRAGELRAYGDAINLQVATEFLKAIKPELMGAR